VSEPTYTILLTQEQIEDVLSDLAAGGYSTTFSLVFDALPAELQDQLFQKWRDETEEEEGNR
jgi:hypothetical protein